MLATAPEAEAFPAQQHLWEVLQLTPAQVFKGIWVLATMVRIASSTLGCLQIRQVRQIFNSLTMTAIGTP
jgi:cytochrome c biogenesis protein ResB